MVSKKLAFLSVLLLLVAGIMAFAGGQSEKSSSSGAKTYTLTVLESTPGFYDLPLRVAINDFGSQYHLNAKIITVTGGGALGTEFEGGTGTVAMVGADTPLRLQQANSVDGGVTILGENMTHMVYVLASKKGSPYHSLSDLKGKNIAITGAGAASEVVLKWALINYAHLNPSKDVTLVPLGNPVTILQGIVNGRVAAGTIFSPATEVGLAKNEIQISFDFRKHPYAQNVFMARTKQVKADPTPYKLLMQAYTAAVNKILSDQNFALSAAQKYWGKNSDPTILKQELQFYMNDEWKGTKFTKELYDATKNVLLSSGDFPTSNFPSYASVTENAPSF